MIIDVKGHRVLLDDEDWERFKNRKMYVYTLGTNSPKKYVRFGNMQSLHRVINQTPKGMLTDHINGNTMDNRRCNLRTVTASQNTQNTRRFNKLGVKGVRQRGNRFEARVKLNGKMNIVGSYSTLAEAVRAYDTKAKELFGEYARPNETYSFWSDPTV